MTDWNNPIYQMYEIAKALGHTDKAKSLLDAYNAMRENKELVARVKELQGLLVEVQIHCLKTFSDYEKALIIIHNKIEQALKKGEAE